MKAEMKIGKIEELQTAAREELYKSTLSGDAAKKRLSAQKAYFSASDKKNVNKFFTRPCSVQYEGMDYSSFCNGSSIALTVDPIPESVEPYSIGVEGDYFNVAKFVDKKALDFEAKINLSSLLAFLKSKGYHKKERGKAFSKALIKYKGSFFDPCLIYKTLGVIQTESPADFWFSKGAFFCENENGKALILGVNIQEKEDTIDYIDLKDFLL